MVRKFFTENPHLVDPVKSVLKKYSADQFSFDSGSKLKDWREAATHYVNNPHEDHDDLAPFYIVDFARIVIQMAKFRKYLPKVQPFYAIKCNTSEAIISMISALGGSFDCASQMEINLVLEGGYSTPENVIFANPCKAVSCMRRAELMRVRFVTFDNITELHKLAQHMPSCKALLRIMTNDSAALCAFSTKFGASMSNVPELLSVAKTLNVRIVGVSFHVGSGNNDPQAYIGSIRNARQVFDMANDLGFDMKVLDLGGGLPGTEPSLGPNGKPTSLSFEEIAVSINSCLEEQFSEATVIAEPGRYFTQATHLLACNIHSMRTVPLFQEGGDVTPTDVEYQYYINDGLYHSFNCILFDHAHPEIYPLRPDSESRIYTTTIFGPTCDSLDCILKRQKFPEMSVGEWLVVPDMGSYTTSAGAPFNGFSTKRTQYIWSLPLDC